MIPNKIVLPMYVICDKCGKKHDFPISYSYCKDSCLKEDIYIKDRLERNFDTCNCEGIKSKCEEAYKNMNSPYTVEH